MNQSASILQEYWGYSTFRPGQQAVIDAVLEGKDALAIMPTGGGKSICYQVPALQLPGLCLVISPLIALMKDQVENLQQKNCTAFALYSGLSRKEVINILEVAGTSNCKFLYVSPERLESDLFKEYLPSLGISLIAVDEAHCISQWGYDFRPPYLRIAEIRKEIPDAPLLALTASATPAIQKDIIEKLELVNPVIIKQSFERPNLSYSAFHVDIAIPKIHSILSSIKGSSIIYCRTRKRTQEIAKLLQAQGYQASWYHAGLDAETRQQRQQDWKEDRTPIMVCTNAFGMGIDKPNVRVVIHVGIPDCLENYYQEAGRAGRDGKKAYAVLLYTSAELEELKQSAEERFPPLAVIKEVYQAIANYLQLPVGSGEGTYFDFDWPSFISRFKFSAPVVMQCLKILEQEEYIQYNEAFFIPARVQFTAPKQVLENLAREDRELDHLCKTMLRTYEGIYDRLVTISEKQLAFKLKLEASEIREQLKKLESIGVIEFQLPKEDPQLYFPINRIRAEDIHIDQVNYQERKKQLELRIKKLLAFVMLTKDCRSQFIAHYFGDEKTPPCGSCDNCLHQKKKSLSTKEFESIHEQVKALLRAESLTTTTLLEMLQNYPEEKIWETLDYLQAEQIIEINQQGMISLLP